VGFPIRTSWDHSSVDSSPRPNAASHVLHRLLVPRHPPSALHNLNTRPQDVRGQKNLNPNIADKQDARVHYAHLNQQPTTTQRGHTNTKNHHWHLAGMRPQACIGSENPSPDPAESPPEACLFFQIFNRVCRPREAWDRFNQPHLPPRFPRLRAGCTTGEKAVVGCCLLVSPPCEPASRRVLEAGPCRFRGGCSLERR
jgi:hypothetical protein